MSIFGPITEEEADAFVEQGVARRDEYGNLYSTVSGTMFISRGNLQAAIAVADAELDGKPGLLRQIIGYPDEEAND